MVKLANKKKGTVPLAISPKTGVLVSLAQAAKTEIWNKTRGYIERHDIFGNRLLIAVYVRPEVTAGGVLLTEDTRKEDVWQGTTGLVLQVGPGCFKDSDKWKFYGQRVDVGDWVSFRPSDGILTTVGGKDGVECRIIQDCYLLARIDGPDVVY